MDKELKTSASISTFTRWMVVAIISCGAYVVYLTYLARYSFYDQVIDGLKISNSQLGVLYGLYGTTATIAYFPGGVLADKVPCKISGNTWICHEFHLDILVFHSSELRTVKDDLPAVWTVYHLHLLGDPL